MMGMYRLIRNAKPAFYELCTIVEENGSLVLRLKHFNPDLKGWEETDKTVDFPLVALVIGQKDGGVREETFSYTRQRPEAK